MKQAKSFIREQFEANRNETSQPKIDELVGAIDEAISFSTQNIVQGTLTDRGNYSAFFFSASMDFAFHSNA